MNTNKNYTGEQLFELYSKAPEDIQGVIRDENLGPAIQVIGKDHGITPVQALDVEDIVLHTLLGIKPVNSFAKQIQEKLGISEDAAQKIARDVDENIFSPVKESLDKIQEINSEGAGSQSQTSYNPADSSGTNTSPQTSEEDLQVPQAPTTKTPESTQPSALPSKIVQKKPKPYTEDPTQTSQTLHKPIVGAEKIGMDIPPIEHRGVNTFSEPQRDEHMFEKKLRETMPPNAPKTISPTKEEVNENEHETKGDPKTLVETPSYGTDPYKEPIE